ncbi:SMC-Scp complex subunit ScpB [Candidatus Kaiserbacteria bacterium]|nr:SMC-Scp complex subunit ScpB [Candidatus Kaiserbacteria bacterium]
MTSLPQLVEAALFFKGGDMSVSELAKAVGASVEKTEEALATLKDSLKGRGVRLVRERDRVALATTPEAGGMIKRMRKDELEGPLGKAGLEALSVIIFRGPVSKSDIDYIRGVNCASILRSLLIRGLVERIDNPSDKRSFLYRATPELPAYLGLSSLEDMPAYEETRAEIERVFAEREKAQTTESSPQAITDEHA